MKKDVFSSWIKELTSLIFVQSFQAFLLAIIMSIIVKALVSDATSIEGGIDAVGLLAIIALSSLSKIELLLKNMFGLTSGQGDPALANGKRSFSVGSMLAMRGFGRILDNGKKIVGGTGRAIAGQFRVRQAMNERNNYAIGQKKLGEEQKPVEENKQTTPLVEAPTNNGYALRGGTYSSGGAITNLSTELSKLTSAIKEQNKNTEKAEKDKDKSDKTKALDDAIKKAEEARNAGLRDIGKGIAETVGAAHGGIAGVTVALAHGDSVIEHGLQGMGAGDVIGEKVADAIHNVGPAVQTVNMGIKAEAKAHTGKTAKAYKKIEDELKKANKEEIAKLDEKIDLFLKSQGKDKTGNIRMKDNDISNQ